MGETQFSISLASTISAKSVWSLKAVSWPLHRFRFNCREKVAKIVHKINGSKKKANSWIYEIYWTHCGCDLHWVLQGDLRYDLKTNIWGLRLPVAVGSLKTRPQDSFRFKYTKNISSFNRALIAQLVEHAGLVLRTGVRFPPLAFFFIKVED
jgi:hypothetical protein